MSIENPMSPQAPTSPANAGTSLPVVPGKPDELRGRPAALHAECSAPGSIDEMPECGMHPTLVVVSGPPGSGKTTLAHALADRLGVPAIVRDEIKQGMVLSGRDTPAAGFDELNIPTRDVFFTVLTVLARAGVTAIAEAAFQDKLWRPNLLPLTEVCDIRIIHCTAPTALIHDRLTTRLQNDPHRQAHNDCDLVSAITAGPESPIDAFDAVRLGVPALTVDTSDDYRPDLDAIARFAIRHPGGPITG